MLATVGDENGERRGELGKGKHLGAKSQNPGHMARGGGGGGRASEMPRGPSIGGKEWG